MTALRAFFTRRLDATTVGWYAMVAGLLFAVIVMGAAVVANQFG